MPFLCRFSHKETCAPLILIPFSLVLKTQFPKQEQRINNKLQIKKPIAFAIGFLFDLFLSGGLLFGIRVDMRLAFRFDVAHQEAQPERPCDNRDASNDCDD